MKKKTLNREICTDNEKCVERRKSNTKVKIQDKKLHATKKFSQCVKNLF